MHLIQIKTIRSASKGKLSVVEKNDINFEIKRLFYIHGVKKGEKRGGHANKRTIQMLICLKGRFKITLDNGKIRKSILLNNPQEGLMVGKMVWNDILCLEDNSLLLAIASTNFRTEDYIRDYSIFLSTSKKINK